MKKWYVTHKEVCSAPSVSNVMSLAETTNVRFGMWNDKNRNLLIIEAENKPQNSPLNNIYWEELPEERLEL